MFRGSTRDRYKAGRLDVLVDLMQNPVVIGCCKIVVGACLSHGIEMRGSTKEFQAFIDRYYYSFLQEAIQCIFFCGFVPWRLVRGTNGVNKKIVPEVLPLGSFEWEVNEIQSGKPHGVSITIRGGGGIDIKEVHIFQAIKPHMDGQALSTPMNSIIRAYEMLRDAEDRQIRSDAWNTRARLIVGHTERQNIYKMSEGGAITAEYEGKHCQVDFEDQMVGDDAEYFSRRHKLHMSIETEADEEHRPDGYTLPSNSKLESVQRLQPVMDVEYLRTTFTAQVASVFGIPYEMIAGGYSAQYSGKKSHENNRYFVSNMQEICRFLEVLLSEVYRVSFKDPGSSFSIHTVPRIEISTVEDIIKLHEAGLLDPTHAKTLVGHLSGKKF